jgi:hypothetical protein
MGKRRDKIERPFISELEIVLPGPTRSGFLGSRTVYGPGKPYVAPDKPYVHTIEVVSPPPRRSR